ncbi:metal-dependent hydrolase [Nocardioides convexus]|uniref:metal-dependent hydrolase n=1 Tax=Nocardioides convexus TaxID=2712224 RepID=UPI0024184248|nr:metal-dependent hydrolase [Nocardioides convexus]
MTAFLGNWVLNSPGLDRLRADPRMLDLIRWHGAEEVEHRHVAYDLFDHLDGRYLRRVRAYVFAAAGIVYLWARSARYLLQHDSTLAEKDLPFLRSLGGRGAQGHPAGSARHGDPVAALPQADVPPPPGGLDQPGRRLPRDLSRRSRGRRAMTVEQRPSLPDTVGYRLLGHLTEGVVRLMPVTARRRPEVRPVDRRIRVRVAAVHAEADDVVSLDLEPVERPSLPAWAPGAHLDVVLPSGRTRQYSLTGDPRDRARYRIAVRRIPDGDGGSREVHDLAVGAEPGAQGSAQRVPVRRRAVVPLRGGRDRRHADPAHGPLRRGARRGLAVRVRRPRPRLASLPRRGGGPGSGVPGPGGDLARRRARRARCRGDRRARPRGRGALLLRPAGDDRRAARRGARRERRGAARRALLRAACRRR